MSLSGLMLLVLLGVTGPALAAEEKSKLDTANIDRITAAKVQMNEQEGIYKVSSPART